MLYFNKTTYEVDADASFNYLNWLLCLEQALQSFSQLS